MDLAFDLEHAVRDMNRRLGQRTPPTLHLASTAIAKNHPFANPFPLRRMLVQVNPRLSDRTQMSDRGERRLHRAEIQPGVLSRPPFAAIHTAAPPHQALLRDPTLSDHLIGEPDDVRPIHPEKTSQLVERSSRLFGNEPQHLDVALVRIPSRGRTLERDPPYSRLSFPFDSHCHKKRGPPKRTPLSPPSPRLCYSGPSPNSLFLIVSTAFPASSSRSSVSCRALTIARPSTPDVSARLIASERPVMTSS